MTGRGERGGGNKQNFFLKGCKERKGESSEASPTCYTTYVRINQLMQIVFGHGIYRQYFDMYSRIRKGGLEVSVRGNNG